MKLKKASLRVKLISSFTLVALLPLVAMAVLYFQNLSELLIGAAERELQVGAQQTAQKLDAFFSENNTALRSQAQFGDFVDFLKNDETYRRQAEARISSIFQSMSRGAYQSYIQSFLLLDTNGQVVYDQTQIDINQNLSAQNFFKLALASNLAQVTLTPPDSRGQRSIYFSAPVWDGDRNKVGVLAMRYNLGIVQLLAGNSASLGGVGSFAIVTEGDGNIVAWNDNLVPPQQQIDHAAFKGDAFARGVVLNGDRYALFHTHLTEAPLHVIYVQSEAAITEFVFSQILVVALISAGILILTTFVALFLANRLANPINALIATARSLMDGGLDARVKINSQDEIGMLGQTFNQMADQIQLELEEVRAAEERYRDLSVSLEQIVQQRTEQLQNANKELESFSYSVSHDLRAPLRAIDGYSRILQEFGDQMDDEAKSYIQRIRASSAQMAQLIDGLLALSRLGRQSLHIEILKPEQMQAMIQDIADALESSSPERRVEWRIAALPPCHADQTLIRQVFANLLGNAFKYTRQRELAIIEVGYADGTFFIADNGAGFDMHYADKLFGVFQRLHHASEFEGTGIGLATVKRIIDRHGGKIWAKSDPGKGATFFFTLGCEETNTCT